MQLRELLQIILIMAVSVASEEQERLQMLLTGKSHHSKNIFRNYFLIKVELRYIVIFRNYFLIKVELRYIVQLLISSNILISEVSQCRGVARIFQRGGS